MDYYIIERPKRLVDIHKKINQLSLLTVKKIGRPTAEDWHILANSIRIRCAPFTPNAHSRRCTFEAHSAKPLRDVVSMRLAEVTRGPSSHTFKTTTT